MVTTAAIVLIDRNGNILGCHATGRPSDSGYDFPKGCVDEGETDFEAACRELKEETGLTLETLAQGHYLVQYDVIDCGVHKHNREKNIHIFVFPVNGFPMHKLKCTSFFELHGKQIAEVDSYAVIGKDDRKMFNRVLWDKFALIDEAVKDVAY